MRPLCRDFFLVVLAPLLVTVAALAARADEKLGISEIRLTAAEEPTDVAAEVRSTLAVTTDEQALPPAPATAPAASRVAGSQPAKRTANPLPFRRTGTTAARAQTEPRVATNQMRQTLNFYGGGPARATLSQFPSRTPIQAGPQRPMQRQIKPFNTIYRDPTVSPYLNLYREENDSEGAPNYFAFVRPELEQIEANRAQDREVQQLSRQLQGRGKTPAAPQYQSAGAPGRSTPARYMDTAQFYGGWSR
jgi:hypothetical protein